MLTDPNYKINSGSESDTDINMISQPKIRLDVISPRVYQ